MGLQPTPIRSPIPSLERLVTIGKRCVCLCPILSFHSPSQGEFKDPTFCVWGFSGNPTEDRVLGRSALSLDLPGVLFFQAVSSLHSPPSFFPATSSLVTQRAVCDSPCIQTLQHSPNAGEYSTVPSFLLSKWE